MEPLFVLYQRVVGFESLAAVSAGESEEVVSLPAVRHDVLGPDPSLSAVWAEVDPILRCEYLQKMHEQVCQAPFSIF